MKVRLMFRRTVGYDADGCSTGSECKTVVVEIPQISEYVPVTNREFECIGLEWLPEQEAGDDSQS